jgi:hypothetical protein
MSSEVKWTIFVGSLASLLAAALMALVTHVSSALSLLGWVIFLELLQLPMIAAARRGRLDPCTAWLRRAPRRNCGDA